MISLSFALVLAAVNTVTVGTYDYGAVVAGQRVEHVFILENPSEIPLRVLKAEPTNRLELGEYDQTIPPGGRGRFPVTLDTRDHYGRLERGLMLDVERGDTLESLRFIILGFVHLPVEVRLLEEESQVRAYRGDPLYAVFGIRDWSGRPEPLRPEVELTPELAGPFKASITPDREPGAYRLRVEAPGPVPDGEHRGQALLRTSVPEYAFLPIPVALTVLDPFTLSPDALQFNIAFLFHRVRFPVPCQAYSDGAFTRPYGPPVEGDAWSVLQDLGERLRVGRGDLSVWVDAGCVQKVEPTPARLAKAVVLREAHGKAFRVLSVSVDHPALSVFSRSEGPSQASVVVSLKEEPAAPFEAVLTVRTDAPGHEVVTVPITVVKE